MKLLVVFLSALAAASANTIFDLPVRPRDLSQVYDIEGRITNGNDAAAGEFPYQVGLSFSNPIGSWWCGGSLIASNWVVTAAHCTTGAINVLVYLGATIRTSPMVTYNVGRSNFRQHKSYNPINLGYDISLINIPSVSFSSTINKVALPKMSSSYSTYAGHMATTSGWGFTSEGSTAITSHLQYAKMQVIENSVCHETYGPLMITSRILCTATPNGMSPCNGDSGGPLVLDSSKTLIGITSFVSNAGCQSGAPAGFVRVTSYLDWIKEHTGIYY